MDKSKGQAKPRKRGTPRDLTATPGETVKGGRKAGGSQQEYLVVTLKDVQVSSYQVPTQSGV